MSSAFTDDLRLAHLLADDADSLTMSRFKALDLHVVNKPDLTPVTDADKSVEEGIRRTLSRARSRDAVVGEEHGATGHSQRRWVIDPIDGTKNFVRGVPVWATLIALMVDDEVVVGCVSAPQLYRRWWASKDGGAWTGRSLLKATPCHVSDVSDLAGASLSYSSLSGWEERDRLDDFLALSRRCWRTRAYGDFWSYMMVAEGAVDIAAEPELELYDMAALDVIVREAGGQFTGLDGKPGPFSGNALASNGRVHEQALAFIGSVYDEDDPDLARRNPGSVHDLSSRRRPPTAGSQEEDPGTGAD
ncbi:MAG TPA: inositol monophosphatase family protein [Nocardioidaceae bacterium]